MSFIKSIINTITYIFSTLLIVLVVILLSNNSDKVVINLNPLPFEIETKGFMVMISFFLFGLFFGLIICSKAIIKKSLENIGNRRAIKKLTKRINKE